MNEENNPKKRKDKIVYQREVLDKDTGELQTIERHITKKVESREFIKVYLDDISGIIGIGSGLERDILTHFFKMATHGTNEFPLGIYYKKKIAASLKTSVEYINNTITKFVKSEILIRRGKGVYILNPEYFFKGDEIARNQVARLVLEYNIIQSPDQLEQ